MPLLPPLPAVPAGAAPSLYLPGDTWSHPTTPNPTWWTPTGNLCLQFQIAATNYATGAAQVIASQWSSSGSNQRSWQVVLSATGTLEFIWSPDGSTTKSAAVTLGAVNGSTITGQIVFQASNGGNATTNFYTSSDGGVSWNALGTTQTSAGVSALFDSTSALIIGAKEPGDVAGTNTPYTGTVAWFRVYDGTTSAGTLVAAIDNRVPWALYQGTAGRYVDTANSGSNPNTWTLLGSRAVWKWAYPSTATNIFQPGIPESTRPGWQVLSGMPLALGFTTSALAAGIWRFMPFVVTTPSPNPIKGLAIQTSVAATGGTAAAQFAIYNADGTGGGPGSLNTDLVGQGTIDLTATAGVHTLTLGTPWQPATGTAYWIGIMWQGTATGNPTFEVHTGPHSSVSGNTFAINVNAYTQTTSSVPNPVTIASGASGIVVGFQQ